MSPRRSRRRPDPEPTPSGGRSPHETIEEHDDGDWVVRSITGSSSAKSYRCPGCDQEIRPATPHVVAYPTEDFGSVEDRRHWHTPCWKARGRRGRNVERSRNAPKH
jgi:hypothetical protein